MNINQIEKESKKNKVINKKLSNIKNFLNIKSIIQFYLLNLKKIFLH